MNDMRFDARFLHDPKEGVFGGKTLRGTTGAAFWVVLVSLFFIAFSTEPVWAGDSAEAFMSATFGLSSARAHKRMEQSGAVAADFVRNGQLTMKGTFEYRSAIFMFGFHAKKGLKHKAVYIASSGDARSDRALYDGLRQAYGIRFGVTQERAASNPWFKGRILLSSTWRPDKNTVIALSYNPEIANRFPGESPKDYPIHLSYVYTKWDK
jgi:hypothetical protein